MDMNLVPDDGEFPVRKVEDHYEFDPPLERVVGDAVCHFRRVDESCFIVTQQCGNKLIAQPINEHTLQLIRAWPRG